MRLTGVDELLLSNIPALVCRNLLFDLANLHSTCQYVDR